MALSVIFQLGDGVEPPEPEVLRSIILQLGAVSVLLVPNLCLHIGEEPND